MGEATKDLLFVERGSLVALRFLLVLLLGVLLWHGKPSLRLAQ